MDKGVQHIFSSTGIIQFINVPSLSNQIPFGGIYLVPNALL